MYSYEDIFSNKKRVLFVTAHPDDVDAYFGGLLAKLNQDNKETFVLVITGGARGSREKEIAEEELQAIRIEEQKEALKILGAKDGNFESLCYLDGEVENNMELIGKIAKYIRKFKPDIVCTHEPFGYYHRFEMKGQTYFSVNHRDHRNTGLSTLDAVYPFSRDRSFFPEHLAELLEPYTIMEVFLSGDGATNTKIDISQVVEEKKKALLCHKSQFEEGSIDEMMEYFKEGDKYIENGNYLKLAW